MNGAYEAFAEAVFNRSTGFDVIPQKGDLQNLFPLVCFVMILCPWWVCLVFQSSSAVMIYLGLLENFDSGGTLGPVRPLRLGVVRKRITESCTLSHVTKWVPRKKEKRVVRPEVFKPFQRAGEGKKRIICMTQDLDQPVRRWTSGCNPFSHHLQNSISSSSLSLIVIVTIITTLFSLQQISGSQSTFAQNTLHRSILPFSKSEVMVRAELGSPVVGFSLHSEPPETVH